jgi:hypothetical protein
MAATRKENERAADDPTALIYSNEKSNFEMP